MSADELSRIGRAAERMRRSRHGLVRVGLPTVAALGAGAGVAIGAASTGGAPGSDGTIPACYNNDTGTLRVTEHAAVGQAGIPECTPAETALSWSTVGPAGPSGSPGAPGPAGASGAPGASGPAGAPLTGQTAFGLTNSGRTFLKLDGVDGESKTKGHAGEIEVLSFAVQGGAGSSGAGAGKVKFNEFTITKKIDKASPVLLKSVATGKHYSKVTLTCRKAGKGQQDFLVIKMNDVVVSSYQTGAQHGVAQPAEEMTLTFQKATETFYDTKGKPLGQLGFKLTPGGLS
jgi:type VI secretion system secreted protein Hcp